MLRYRRRIRPMKVLLPKGAPGPKLSGLPNNIGPGVSKYEIVVASRAFQ